MDERPGFRATFDQREWLEDARLAAGEASLSDWLREAAVRAGEKVLNKPYPRRQVEPPKKKSRKG